MDAHAQNKGCQQEKAKEVVVTNKAFKIASAWVQNMAGGADFDAEEDVRALPEDDDEDVRPMRLGLGAKYLPHSQANRATNQVERKLRAKLNVAGTNPYYKGGRRESKAPANDGSEVEPDEEEGDSRASAFKKRPVASFKPAVIVSEATGSKKKKRRKGP